LASYASVSLQTSLSQIGSGSLPVDRIASWSLVIHPKAKGSGRALQALAAALRQLPLPVIGRMKDAALWLDLRTLEDEAVFLAQLNQLSLAELPA
jgi:L-seryl-tRNA(Ser) seleniumtransferase